jgi:YfiH family protein
VPIQRKSRSKNTIAHTDALLHSGGLTHGKRLTRKGLSGPRRQKSELRDWPPQGVWLRSNPAPAKPNNALEILTEPQWNQYHWLRHGFSSRPPGASTIYSQNPAKKSAAELNLSWTQDDDSKAVTENRRRFTAAVAHGSKFKLISLRQFHSGLIRNLDLVDSDMVSDGRALLRGDGMFTSRPGLLLGIQTADCIPVLIFDPKKRVIASFHAGWRGTLARIVERGVGALRLTYNSRPADLRAAIGPGIGPCCYAVSEDLRTQFDSQFSYAADLFCEVFDSDPIRDKYPMLFLTQRAPGHSSTGPQIHLDLWEANRRQLLAAGLRKSNVTVMASCTSCQPQRFFSHRRDHGFTGRMLNVIGIAD